MEYGITIMVTDANLNLYYRAAESGMENEAKNLHRRPPANNGSLIA